MNGAQISIEPTILSSAREILERFNTVRLEDDGEPASGLGTQDPATWRCRTTIVEDIDGESFGADRLDLAQQVVDSGLALSIRKDIGGAMQRQAVPTCVPLDERLYRFVAGADREHGVEDARWHAGDSETRRPLGDTGSGRARFAQCQSRRQGAIRERPSGIEEQPDVRCYVGK